MAELHTELRAQKKDLHLEEGGGKGQERSPFDWIIEMGGEKSYSVQT